MVLNLQLNIYKIYNLCLCNNKTHRKEEQFTVPSTGGLKLEFHCPYSDVLILTLLPSKTINFKNEDEIGVSAASKLSVNMISCQDPGGIGGTVRVFGEEELNDSNQMIIHVLLIPEPACNNFRIYIVQVNISLST